MNIFSEEFIAGFRDGHDQGYAAGYEDARREIEDAAPQWIRVKDELPPSGEFGKIVLACNDVGTVNAAYLSSYGKWYAANNTMYDAWSWMPNVTHWMPLPEPPKEAQE